MARVSEPYQAVPGGYFAGDADAGLELARLRFLEELYDPRCRQALLTAGLEPGMRVLEIGPGAGSMLRWLADTVGSDGEVVALDLNPRFLADLALPNLTIITGDIDDAPISGPFDIVYMRFVLMHLSDPGRSLGAIKGMLRPGGALVAADLDMATHIAASVDHSGAALFDRRRAAMVDGLVDAGVMNLNFARQLGVLLRGAGLGIEALSYETHAVNGGTRAAGFWKMGSEETVKAAIRSGCTGPEAADFLPLHDDPDFCFLAPLVATAIARRSEDTGRKQPPVCL